MSDMKVFRAVGCVGILVSLTVFTSRANYAIQDKPQSVVGVVVQTDAGSKTLTLRTDAGESVSIQTDDNTRLVRIPAGERTLTNAIAIQFGDIISGDRVLSNGTRAG